MEQIESAVENPQDAAIGPLLPSQYFGALVGRSANVYQDGEKRLMLAILEDAIRVYLGVNCCTSNKSSAARQKREAAHWIFIDRSPSLFAFESLCDALGISADYVRS